MTEEVWKPVVGFEGLYEVSNLGRVRSLDRVLHSGGAVRGYPRRVRGRILKPQQHPAGYLHVGLGQAGSRIIGPLVLAAFRGPRPSDRHEACHNNGRKHDNVLTNLRWGTEAENAQDKVAHGTSPRGENNGCAKLTEADVLAIRASSAGRQSLAATYDVHAKHIDRIRRGTRWAHV